MTAKKRNTQIPPEAIESPAGEGDRFSVCAVDLEQELENKKGNPETKPRNKTRRNSPTSTELEGVIIKVFGNDKPKDDIEIA